MHARYSRGAARIRNLSSAFVYFVLDGTTDAADGGCVDVLVRAGFTCHVRCSSH